jgi:hypothetical protein
MQFTGCGPDKLKQITPDRRVNIFVRRSNTNAPVLNSDFTACRPLDRSNQILMRTGIKGLPRPGCWISCSAGAVDIYEAFSFRLAESISPLKHHPKCPAFA